VKEGKRKAREENRNQQRQNKAKVAKGKRTGRRVSKSSDSVASDAVLFMDDDSVDYEQSFLDVCPVYKVLKANEDSEGWLECESCSKCWHVVCAGYDVNEIDHAVVCVCNEFS